MNLLTIVSGESLSIMSIFLIMVGSDFTTGYVKALKCYTWVSYINLYGLFTKFITFSTIICAAALDKITPTVGIMLPVNVAIIWTALLIAYEIGSILENAHDFGLKITWLRIFERDVGKTPDKDDPENNVQWRMRTTCLAQKQPCNLEI